jgi:uncharacterized membrane protein
MGGKLSLRLGRLIVAALLLVGLLAMPSSARPTVRTLDDTGDFSLSAPLATLEVNQGGSGGAEIDVVPSGGFNSAVELSVSGLPAGAKASFKPDPATPSPPFTASTMTIKTSATTPAGTFGLTVTGTSGEVSHSTGITLSVVSPDFTISASPSTRSVPPGTPASYPITLDRVGGLTAAVSLGVSGLPAGAKGTFTTGATPVLKITTEVSTPEGSYPLTITGKSGKLTRTTDATLVVDAASAFTLSAPLAGQTVDEGASTTYEVDVIPSGSFGGDVTFSVVGIPSGAVASFSPATVSADSPFVATTLTVSATTKAVMGVHDLTIVGTSGGLKRWTDVTLQVVAADFLLSVTPSLQSIAPGTDADFDVTEIPSGGFSAAVNLTTKVSGAPAGITAFTADGSVLDSSTNLGVITDPDVAAGEYTITVTGTSGLISHSMSVVVEVAKPDFDLASDVDEQSVAAGDSASYTISVDDLRGFTGAVTLGVSGAPGDTTATFPLDNPTFTTSSLDVSTAADTPPGTYTLTVTGTSGGLSHSVDVTLIVSAAQDFGLSPTPAERAVQPGDSVTFSVAVSRSGGFGGAVDLSAPSFPSHVTGSFDIGTVTTGTSQVATLTVDTTANVASGAYTLTITGASGELSHSATVTLVVAATATADFSLSPFPASVTSAAGGVATFDVSIVRTGGYAKPVSFTVQGLPTGATDTFSPSSTTSGVTELTVTTKTSTIVATYPLTITGKAGTLTHTANVDLVVGSPSASDFTLTSMPASVTVVAGQDALYNISVGPVAGFVYDVGTGAWQYSGAPSDSNGYFADAKSGVRQLTIVTDPSTPAGTYTITVAATLNDFSAGPLNPGPDVTHSLTVKLVVGPFSPDFALKGTPSAITVAPGSDAIFDVAVQPSGGFEYEKGNGTWSVSGFPSGATHYGAFSNDGWQLTVVTSPSTPENAYTLTITASLQDFSAGPLSPGVTKTHTTTVIVNVSTTKPDFSLAPSPSTVTVAKGVLATYDVAVDAQTGFTFAPSAAKWSVTGVPGGTANAILAQSSDGESMTISTNSTAPGTYTLTVKAILKDIGTGASITHTVTVKLVVTH